MKKLFVLTHKTVLHVNAKIIGRIFDKITLLDYLPATVVVWGFLNGI